MIPPCLEEYHLCLTLEGGILVHILTHPYKAYNILRSVPEGSNVFEHLEAHKEVGQSCKHPLHIKVGHSKGND